MGMPDSAVMDLSILPVFGSAASSLRHGSKPVRTTLSLVAAKLATSLADRSTLLRTSMQLVLTMCVN